MLDTADRLLTPGEVAALFRVDPKTVARWGAAGRIGSVRTPGGHRRYRESEVRALLEGDGESGTTAAAPVDDLIPKAPAPRTATVAPASRNDRGW
jgi:excisionase family DNA binding protein